MHGVFEQTPDIHWKSAIGCPQCYGHVKRSTKEFIDAAKKIHGDRYDYSQTIYKGDGRNVTVICLLHGPFSQRANAHIHQSQGCPRCKAEKMTKTFDSFIRQSRMIHGDRYDYTDVHYAGMDKKVKIKCPVHGHFFQTPHNHLQGSGCAKCSKKISKSEISFLNAVGITEKMRQYPIPNTKYQVDGYEPSTRTVYEFLGDFWHGNPDVYKIPKPISENSDITTDTLRYRTILKFDRLLSLGYSIRYIWESDWKSKNVDGIKIYNQLNKL